MDRTWIVVIEATAPTGQPALEPGAIQRLVEAVAEHEPSVVHDPSRYALQLRVRSQTPAEALFSATASWAHALQRLALPPWTLVRAEVLTEEEFTSDCDAFYPRARGQDGGALLRPQTARPADDELLNRAFTDSLTGLANRGLFRDRVRNALAEAATDAVVGVLVLDLDDFAALNHDVGYAAGDQVLALLATRLVQSAAGTTAVGRLGGDAFAILVAPASAEALADMAVRVMGSLRAPLDVAGRSLSVRASVGVALASSDTDADELMDRAAIAMGASREKGGDRYRVFETDMDSDIRRFDLGANPAPDRMAHIVLLQRAALAANESQSLEAATVSVLQQVCALTGWVAGNLWVTDATGTGMAPTDIWNPSLPARLGPLRASIRSVAAGTGGALPGQVLATGRATWTTDVAMDGGVPAAIAAEAGLRSAFAFPVLVRREVVAVLEFYGERSSAPEDSLSDVMASVCAQLGRVVERSRAEAALSASEERYRVLVDSAPMLIWRSGVDARCTFLNSQLLRFLGWGAEEAMGEGWLEGVHPDDRVRCEETYLRAFERREPLEMEHRLRRADGEYRWVLVRAQPVGHGETFAGYVGGCLDITEKGRAHDEIRDREIHFRALVQNADVMIVVLAADGSVIEEYTGTFDLGYPNGSGVARFGQDHVHPDDLQRAEAEFADVLSRPGQGRPFQCRVRHADGSWRWIETVANNLLDDPTVGGIVLTVADVSARKESEQAVRDWAGHLREAQALAHTGSWWRDLRSGESFWSEELYRILGRTDVDHPAGLANFLATVHPDDRDRLTEVTAALAEGQAQSAEYRIVRPSGEVRRISSRSAAVRDAAGTPVRVFGTLTDVDWR
ncbi:MAG: PAS domain-containing protein [Actinomycetota bacterium]|nr:PAS domain-containing protein [Actinomycetota bacterium]